MDLAAWKGFALLRTEFSPQAGNQAFFLPWHRYFLRLVERELQSMSSCKLAIPYFEWTVDSGSMKSSAAWQAGLFGGDGEPGSDCIPHHPFQGVTSHFHWSPCLRRSFNSSVCQTTSIHLTAHLAELSVHCSILRCITGVSFVCNRFLLLPLGVAAKCSEPSEDCKPGRLPVVLPVSANLFWPL